MTLAKQNSYFQKKKSRREEKDDAKRRTYNRERRDYLMKIGKISDEINGVGGKFRKK